MKQKLTLKAKSFFRSFINNVPSLPKKKSVECVNSFSKEDSLVVFEVIDTSRQTRRCSVMPDSDDDRMVSPGRRAQRRNSVTKYSFN